MWFNEVTNNLTKYFLCHRSRVLGHKHTGKVKVEWIQSVNNRDHESVGIGSLLSSHKTKFVRKSEIENRKSEVFYLQ